MATAVWRTMVAVVRRTRSASVAGWGACRTQHHDAHNADVYLRRIRAWARRRQTFSLAGLARGRPRFDRRHRRSDARPGQQTPTAPTATPAGARITAAY